MRRRRKPYEVFTYIPQGQVAPRRALVKTWPTAMATLEQFRRDYTDAQRLLARRRGQLGALYAQQLAGSKVSIVDRRTGRVEFSCSLMLD